ncbi:L-threonylcarbamoyladenylate synthase [Nocardioides terrisoli]|uniref:L-threonylcarbamoyladenylate synthase n=1 Tax=Nocardioides terrisoli TaxID=3388267 RepID=UPI00287B9F50|nr:L-threonylcarbamoyladenylate synthase [Nocardioides marmorisolisilvae]
MTPVANRYDVGDPDQREAGLVAAVGAVRKGALVVLPTDTVYGVGADAFSPVAVARLLEAKGRGRETPPPVLVASADTLDALVVGVPDWVRALVASYWPGPLTLVCHQQGSLRWDLGETRGTVAVRMPDDPVALELLGRTGPMAVTSANLTGLPAATDADGAQAMLGDAVEVVLDGGPTAGDVPSTILDCTGERPRVLREGALAIDELRTFLAGHDVTIDSGSGAEADTDSETDADPDSAPEV